MDALYKWLLEDSNPAIKYRTQKELPESVKFKLHDSLKSL